MRGEKTIAWQLKQAEKQRARLIKTLEWALGELETLLGGIDYDRSAILKELDAIDGEKRPEPKKVKKVRKPRDPNKPPRKKRVKKTVLIETENGGAIKLNGK